MGTFGCLAMCCTTQKETLRLVNDIRGLGSRINNVIMTTMIRNAARRWSPADMTVMLKIVEQEGLRPSTRMLKTVEDFHQEFRQHVLKKEQRGEWVPYPVVLEMRNDLKNWTEFRRFYKEWLERQDLEPPEHPWE